VPIVPADPGQADRLAALVAEAFHPLAVAAWLVSDPAERARTLPRQFAILIEHAFTHGHVDVVADRTAVAVWMHRTGPDFPAPADYDRRLEAACGAHVDRFRTLDDLFDTHHPDGPPHHHLALLAVHPATQGAGLGTALLRHHHRHLDAQHLPAYLEAACPRSAALYNRHGYRQRGTLTLPDGPGIYPMWRNPQ
jgi:ribosomal protein S18 acetylase RimI-like enzyme